MKDSIHSGPCRRRSVPLVFAAPHLALWAALAAARLSAQQDQTVTGNLTVAGSTAVNSTAASTSTTTGALTVGGGLGVQGNANIGGGLSATAFTVGGGSIVGSASGLTLLAGGTDDQNITLTPTGAGSTILNGNIGIGTSIPQQKLTVKGSAVASRGGYSLNGVAWGSTVFTSETLSNGNAGLIGTGGWNGLAIKTNPFGNTYGAVGVVGAAYNAGGGRGSAGLYGYSVFNETGTHTNTANNLAGGYLLAELGSVVTDFRGELFGAFAKADASAAAGSDPGKVTGVRGAGLGRSIDKVYGGYFSATGGATNYGVYSVAGQNYFADSIGVGTTTPTATLDVNGTLKTGSQQWRFKPSGAQLYLSGTTGTDLSGVYMGAVYEGDNANEFVVAAGAEWANEAGQITSWTARSTSAGIFRIDSGYFTFFTGESLANGSAFSPVQRMVLTPGGNLGLGTATPTTRLDVAGDAKISGGLQVAGTFTAANYTATAGAVYGGVSGLTLNAGGTGNQNITFSPTGNGAAVVDGKTLTLKNDNDTASGLISQILAQRETYDPTGNAAAIQFYRGAGTSEGRIAFATNSGSAAGQAPVERMRITENGSVGIGTSAPDAKLSIVGGHISVGASGASNQDLFIANAGGRKIEIVTDAEGDGRLMLRDAAATASQVVITAGGNSYLNGGNVGIGTVTPTEKLDVVGGKIAARKDTNTSTSWSDVQFVAYGATDPAKRLGMGVDTTGNFGYVQAWRDNDASYSLGLNPKGGKVGIGTTTPAATLDVAGNAKVQGNADVTGTLNAASLQIAGQPFNPANYVQQSGGVVAGALSATALTATGGGITGGSMGLSLIASGTDDQSITLTPTGSGSILLNGNVGFGTATPVAPLHLSPGNSALQMRLERKVSQINTWDARIGNDIGSLASGSLLIQNSQNTADIALRGTNSGNAQLVVQGASGNVGIGVTNPGARLSVNKTSVTTWDAIAEFSGAQSNGRFLVTWFPVGVDSDRAGLMWENQGIANMRMWMGNDQYLYSSKDDPTNSLDGRRFIQENQMHNVGIGTTAPTATLDVAGNAKVQGNADVTGTLNAASLQIAGQPFNPANYVQQSGGVVTGALSATVLTATGGSLTGGATGLTLNAGSANQSVTLVPEGTGVVNIGTGNSGDLRVKGTTSATDTSTGALVVSGGAAVAENLFVGKRLVANKSFGQLAAGPTNGSGAGHYLGAAGVGDASGTTDFRPIAISASGMGSNPMAHVRGLDASAYWGGGGTAPLGSLVAIRGIAGNYNSGSITSLEVVSASPSVTGSGNITSKVQVYSAGLGAFSSTGDIVGDIYGFSAANLGRTAARSVTAFDAADQTKGIGNAYGFRGRLTAGTGKYNLHMDGDAANLLAGQTTISNQTPSTESTSGALVVSGGVGVGGSLNVEGNLAVRGTFTAAGFGGGTVTGGSSGLTLNSGATDQSIAFTTAGTGGLVMQRATGKAWQRLASSTDRAVLELNGFAQETNGLASNGYYAGVALKALDATIGNYAGIENSNQAGLANARLNFVNLSHAATNAAGAVDVLTGVVGSNTLSRVARFDGGGVTIDKGLLTGGVAGLILSAGAVDQNVSLVTIGQGIVTTNANVGIGISASTALGNGVKLQLHNANSNQTQLYFTNSDSGSTSGDGLRVGMGTGLTALVWNNENAALRFGTNNAEQARITGAGEVLLGTSTTNGNGRLQLADHTTAAGGIGLGSNVSIFRSGAGELSVSTAGGLATKWDVNRNQYLMGDVRPVSPDAFDLGTSGLAMRTIYGRTVLVTGTTASANKDTGALVVEGGAGIEGNVNVGGGLGLAGDAAVHGGLTVDSVAILNSGLNVTGSTLLTGMLTVTSGAVIYGATNLQTASVAGASTFGDTMTFASGGNAMGAISWGNTPVTSTQLVAGTGRSLLLGANGSATTGLTIAAPSGNVGIGTTSPAEALHVQRTGANASLFLETIASGTPSIFMKQGAGSKYLVLDLNAANILSLGWEAPTVRIGTGGVERVRIDAAGNVGIGTPSPSEKLDVTGNGKVTDSLYVNTAGGAGNSLSVGALTGGGNLRLLGSASLWSLVNSSSGQLQFLKAAADGSGAANMLVFGADGQATFSRQVTAASGLVSQGNVSVTGAVAVAGNMTLTAGGTLDLGNSRIMSVATPTTGTDATNKTYVDASIPFGWQGLAGSSVYLKNPAHWLGLGILPPAAPLAPLHVFNAGPDGEMARFTPKNPGTNRSFLRMDYKNLSTNWWEFSVQDEFDYNSVSGFAIRSQYPSNGVSKPRLYINPAGANDDRSFLRLYSQNAEKAWEFSVENGSRTNSGAAADGFALRKVSNATSAPTSEVSLYVENSGNVGIGTTQPQGYKLAVNGTIHAKEVVVDMTGWSDFVFAPGYRNAPLSEVEEHIKEHKHLPGVPSTHEVTEKGVSVGQMQAVLLAKVEELTLHLIEQEKRIERLEAENAALRTTHN